MTIDFLFEALCEIEFKQYFDMSDHELATHGAYIFESDEYPCYPCRVSLTDAKIGEKVLALSYEHLGEDSPYRSSGPIFVRQNAETARPVKNEVPEILRLRPGLLSVRGYNADHLMIEAETTPGNEVEVVLSQLFANDTVQFIHVHNAGPGCFNCSVQRV